MGVQVQSIIRHHQMVINFMTYVEFLLTKITQVLPRVIFYVLLCLCSIHGLRAQKRIDQDSVEVMNRIAIADSLFKVYEFEKALPIYEEVILKQASLTYQQRTKVYNRLGDGYYNTRVYDKSLNYYLANLENNPESTSIRAGIEYRLGRLYAFYLHDYKNALNYFLSSKSIFQSEGNDFWRTIDVALGNVYLQTEVYDSAIFYYGQAKGLLESQDDRRSLADLYNNWGFCYSEMNQLRLSDSLYDLSFSLYNSSSDSLGLAALYHNMGLNDLKKESHPEAASHFGQSLNYSGDDFLGNYRKALYGLGQAHSHLGDYETSLDYFLEYDSLNNIHLNQERSEEIARLEVLHNVREYQRNSLLGEVELARQKRGKAYVVGAMILILGVFSVYLYTSEQRKKALKAITEKNQQLANQKVNDLLQQQEIHSLQGVLAGQEEERQRIATDLHDKLGAILGMVKLHFSAVEERIDDLRDDNKKQYAKANELLDQASSEVRNISHNLLSGVLVKFGLVPALHDLKSTVEATGKLKVQLVLGDQMGIRLGGEQELQIYRIVQELISNILKHAKATEAVIQLNRTNGTVNLIVEDNGTGFNVEAARQKSGIGLKNLEARAAKLNAQIHFDSGKGAGTTVSVDIPIENEKL